MNDVDVQRETLAQPALLAPVARPDGLSIAAAEPGPDALDPSQLPADGLLTDPVQGFKLGQGSGFAPDTMSRWNTGLREGGVKGKANGMGASLGAATTSADGGDKKTTLNTWKNGLSNPRGTREKVEAEDNADYSSAFREKTSTGLTGKKKTTQSTSFKDKDGTTVNGTVTRKDKKGGSTVEGLDKKGDTEGKAKGAEKDAGVRKLFKGGVTRKLKQHVKLGAIGDESGVDLGAFDQDREEKAGFYGAEAGLTEIEGGHLAKAEAYAGPRASGNVLAEGRDKDAFGNARTSRAGATGEVLAGGLASTSAYHRRTRSGAEVGAQMLASLGLGGEGAAGATTETRLSDTIKAKAGAQVKGNGFMGVKAGASTTAKHGKANAKVGGEARAMAGAEVGGTAGIDAAINGAGFDLVGARAQAGGKAMAGLDARASGEASADPLKGAKAQGQVEASANAKAEGEAKAGVSLGGADGDVVAAGKAKAGADVAAAGQVNAGVLGVGGEGSLEAFAGAKAAGELRFELGAGGLNLGLVGVQGEVSAGAGVRLTGKLNLSLTKVGVQARGGVTWGVGAGLGGLFEVDPTFPVRLTLAKLAENKVIPTDDIVDLIGTAASLVYKPAGRGGPQKAAPMSGASDSLVVDSAAADRLVLDEPEQPDALRLEAAQEAARGEEVAQPVVMSRDLCVAAPAAAEVEDAVGEPDKAVPVDELLASLNPSQAEALEKTQAAIKADMEATSQALMGDVGAVMGAGGKAYAGLMGSLSKAITSSEGVLKTADADMRALIATGVAEAGGVREELDALGRTVVADIQRLVTSDPKSLLDGGWEGAIDAGVERVRAFAASVRARVAAIIERTRKAVAAVADKAVAAAMTPIRGVAGVLGGVLGGFGAEVSSIGLGMIGRLRGTLEPVEKGVKVRGMGGVLALPFKASPALTEAEKPVQELAGFGERSVSAGMGAIVDLIGKGLREALGTQSGGLLGALAGAASALTGAVLDVPVKLAEGAAAVAKPIIRTAIAVVKAMMEAARKAAEVARKAAEAAAAGVKKAVSTVASVATKVVNTVGDGLRKAGNWFLSLFRR